MTRRIAIIQGHSDPSGDHLLHAMADAYAHAAASAGHDARRIEVAQLAFPLLRTQADFETGALPPALAQPRRAAMSLKPFDSDVKIAEATVIDKRLSRRIIAKTS